MLNLNRPQETGCSDGMGDGNRRAVVSSPLEEWLLRGCFRVEAPGGLKLIRVRTSVKS